MRGASPSPELRRNVSRGGYHLEPESLLPVFDEVIADRDRRTGLGDRP
jgi:hypothetical protein